MSDSSGPMAGYDPTDGRVEVMAKDLAAIRENGVWRRGTVAPDDLWDNFIAINDPAQARALAAEARAALSSTAGNRPTGD